MTALEATESEVAALLADETDVGIAAVNGPSSLVISGAEAAVGRVAEQVRAAGGRIKRLPVSHAFHSPLVEPMLADFAAVADEIDFRAPEIPLVSGVTGQVATEREWGSPDYWVRHARLAVRFRDVVHTLRDLGVTTALELGPDAALTPMVAESSGELAAVASLRVGRPETVALMAAVARLFAAAWTSTGTVCSIVRAVPTCPRTPSSESGTGSMAHTFPGLSGGPRRTVASPHRTSEARTSRAPYAWCAS